MKETKPAATGDFVGPTRTLEQRQSVFTYTPTNTGRFSYPQAGALSRMQKYRYIGDGNINNPQNIQNAELLNICNNGQVLTAIHHFTQSFGNQICCCALAHSIRIDAFDDHPTFWNWRALAETCVSMSSNQCPEVTTVNCVRELSQLGFSRG